MKQSIFKPIVFGILFGAGIFFMPFMILKCVFFFMFIGFIFRMFAWRRWRGGGMNYQSMYTDKIRNMSEEEYSEFKNKSQSGCGHGHYYNHCYTYGDCNSKNDCSSKKESETDSEKK